MMQDNNKLLIKELEKELEYKFNNKELILEAITHPSVDCKFNNERLEFLGDAVLNLIIAEELYKKYRNIREDKLSSIRAKLISCDAICMIAKKLKIKEIIILSFGEERNGGRENLRNIENAFEAIIGALYIDAGIFETKKIVARLWKNLIRNQDILGPDYKTYLQEWAQKNKYKIPSYLVVSSEGPSHAPNFVIKVVVENCGEALGKGHNKKEAEKNAAKAFFENIING